MVGDNDIDTNLSVATHYENNSVNDSIFFQQQHQHRRHLCEWTHFGHFGRCPVVFEKLQEDQATRAGICDRAKITQKKN